MTYEKQCEQTLRNQEEFVRELRYQAAANGGDDIHRALRHHEGELSKIRLFIMHTISDPAVAAKIIGAAFRKAGGEFPSMAGEDTNR